MKLVVGLGNPGKRYTGTRHNVGFDVVERLASRHGIQLAQDKRLDAVLGKGLIGSQSVWLVQPMTYMNNSGPVVARIVRERQLGPQDLLVLTDDYHLALGVLRLREQGSAGGHNGMKSIIGCLGGQEFARLRIGVGQPAEGEAVDFVLSKFKPAERDLVDETLDRARDCAEDWCTLGGPSAMNRHNTPRGDA